MVEMRNGSGGIKGANRARAAQHTWVLEGVRQFFRNQIRILRKAKNNFFGPRVIKEGYAFRVIFYFSADEGTFVDNAFVRLYENGAVTVYTPIEETTVHIMNCEIVWTLKIDKLSGAFKSNTSSENPLKESSLTTGTGGSGSSSGGAKVRFLRPKTTGKPPGNPTRH